MDFYVLILRILHIFGAVFWAGSTWMLAGFLTPAVKAAGQGGQAVMKAIITKRKLSEALALAALINVVTGLLLYWRSSGGLNPGWLTSGPGLSLTIGGLAGLVAFFIGAFVTRPATVKIGELGERLAASDGPPPPELMEQMQGVQATLESAGIWISVLLIVALLGMAAAEVLFV